MLFPLLQAVVKTVTMWRARPSFQLFRTSKAAQALLHSSQSAYKPSQENDLPDWVEKTPARLLGVTEEEYLRNKNDVSFLSKATTKRFLKDPGKKMYAENVKPELITKAEMAKVAMFVPRSSGQSHLPKSSSKGNVQKKLQPPPKSNKRSKSHKRSKSSKRSQSRKRPKSEKRSKSKSKASSGKMQPADVGFYEIVEIESNEISENAIIDLVDKDAGPFFKNVSCTNSGYSNEIASDLLTSKLISLTTPGYYQMFPQKYEATNEIGFFRTIWPSVSHLLKNLPPDETKLLYELTNSKIKFPIQLKPKSDTQKIENVTKDAGPITINVQPDGVFTAEGIAPDSEEQLVLSTLEIKKPNIFKLMEDSQREKLKIYRQILFQCIACDSDTAILTDARTGIRIVQFDGLREKLGAESETEKRFVLKVKERTFLFNDSTVTETLGVYYALRRVVEHLRSGKKSLITAKMQLIKETLTRSPMSIAQMLCHLNDEFHTEYANYLTSLQDTTLSRSRVLKLNGLESVKYINSLRFGEPYQKITMTSEEYQKVLGNQQDDNASLTITRSRSYIGPGTLVDIKFYDPALALLDGSSYDAETYDNKLDSFCDQVDSVIYYSKTRSILDTESILRSDLLSDGVLELKTCFGPKEFTVGRGYYTAEISGDRTSRLPADIWKKGSLSRSLAEEELTKFQSAIGPHGTLSKRSFIFLDGGKECIITGYVPYDSETEEQYEDLSSEEEMEKFKNGEYFDEDEDLCVI